MVKEMHMKGSTNHNKYTLVFVFLFIMGCILLTGSVFVFQLVQKAFDAQYYWMHEPSFVEVSTGSATGKGLAPNLQYAQSPYLAISPHNEPYVAWTGSEQNGLNITYWDGTVWHRIDTSSLVLQDTVSQEMSRAPALAFAEDRSLYLTWDQRGSIRVARWNGDKWSEVGDGSIYGNGISQPEEVARHPSIAISSEGTVYVTWQLYLNNKPEIYVKQWNGLDWSYIYTPEEEANDVNNNTTSFVPQIVVNSQNTLFLLWVESDRQIQSFHVRQWDGVKWSEVGKSYTTGNGIGFVKEPSTIKLASDDYVIWTENLPSITVSSNDGLYVAWHDSSTTIAVRHWAPGQTDWDVMDYQATFETVSDPHITTGLNNRVYLVWKGKIGLEYGVYVLYWDGNSWEEVVKGSARANGIGNGETFNFEPRIAVTSDNIVYVVWEALPQGEFNSRYIYVRRWQP